jgi:predicted transcriptional regulator
MNTHLKINATPYRQFTLRLTHDLADELERVSKQTRINKTTISRIALQKFLAQIEQSGANEMLDEVCAV